MSRMRRAVLISTSVGVALSGTLVGGTSTAAGGAEAAKAASTVHVYVARNHAIAMTQRIRPGMHKFVVRSGGRAAFQLLSAARGYTKREAARDLNRAFDRGNLRAQKRFERNITLLGGAASTPTEQAVMWARLPRGRYWAVDTDPDHIDPGKILTVSALGARVTGGVRATSMVRAVDETTWAKRPARIAHRGRLVFRNDSVDNHFVILVKLAKGKTIRDFRRWIRQVKKGGNNPPPINQRYELDTGVLSPGHQMVVRYNLPRGRYVLACFWPDADMGGAPHAFMGMYRGIRLR